MVQIRNVPDTLRRKLKVRAANSGRTLSDYLLAALTMAGAILFVHQSVLRAVGGNRSQAAQKLGIGEATLYRKTKQFGDG